MPFCNIRIIFLSLVIFCTNTAYSMKRQLKITPEQKIKKIKIEQVYAMPSLPFELQEQIFVACLPQQAATNPFQVICHTINAISFVNKEWNHYINHPWPIYLIINTINDCAQNSAFVNRFMIAKTIQTSGTKNYVHQCSALYSKIKGSLPPSPYSIKNLVEMGADTNFEHLKGPFLHITVKNKNYTYTKQLLELGANPNPREYGKTALDVAIEEENLAIIELLLQYNPIDKGMLTAIRNGNDSIIKLLLAKGNLTEDELHSAHLYAFATKPINPAAQVLIDHFVEHHT